MAYGKTANTRILHWQHSQNKPTLLTGTMTGVLMTKVLKPAREHRLQACNNLNSIIIAAAGRSLADTQIIFPNPIEIVGQPVTLGKIYPATINEKNLPLNINKRKLIFQRIEYGTIKFLVQVRLGCNTFKQFNVHSVSENIVDHAHLRKHLNDAE
ncbi:hypothetical protein C2846_07705 [Pseudomonas jilinensis]|uniref:Uncharacterized protein n=1 Tax=Pseudomonas jilinensis TaxID=2078689 RepID=A0A396S6T0_9PSED|nr:hypothetical protein C2846_07705 [Pseudomonas jilinensis]